MDEVAFPFEEFVDGVADVPCDLVLPQTVRHTRDSGNLNRHVDSSMKNSTTYRCSPAENPPISPITIFRSHADYEFLDFTGDAWPPASAPGTAAPASNVSGVTRSTRRVDKFGFCCQAATLIISKPKLVSAKLLSQDSILSAQVAHHFEFVQSTCEAASALTASDPATEGPAWLGGPDRTYEAEPSRTRRCSESQLRVQSRRE